MFLCAESTLATAAVLVSSFVTLVQSKTLLLVDCIEDDYSIGCNGKGNVSSLSLQNFTAKDTIQSFYMSGWSLDDVQSTIWQHLPALAFQGLPVSN